MEAQTAESQEVRGAHTAHGVTHEAERMARAAIVWASVAVILFSIVLGVMALIVFNVRRSAIEGDVERSQPEVPGRAISGVRTDLLRPRPGSGDLDKARQRRELERFSWVDREHGIVRIPIETAIDLELAESAK